MDLHFGGHHSAHYTTCSQNKLRWLPIPCPLSYSRERCPHRMLCSWCGAGPHCRLGSKDPLAPARFCVLLSLPFGGNMSPCAPAKAITRPPLSQPDQGFHPIELFSKDTASVLSLSPWEPLNLPSPWAGRQMPFIWWQEVPDSQPESKKIKREISPLRARGSIG